MPTDKELKRAADESLDKFSKLYDPKGENPTATVNAYKLYKSLSLSDIEAKGDKPSSTAGKFAKGTLGIIQTQEAGGSYADSKSVVNAEKVFSLAFDTKGNLLESGKIFSNILEEAGTQGKQELSNQAVLLTDINTKTGLTGKLSKNYREEISAAYPALARLGIEYSELANAAVSLVQQSGKFNLINKEQFESMGLAAKAYVGSIAEVVEMIPGFERVGIGATGVVKAVSEAGARSINLGLSSQKITKELGQNIGLLNYILSLKNGYDTIVDPFGKKLPGTIAKKILLLRAICNEPRLLLLEEPWQGLEKTDQNKIVDYLLNKLPNTTVIVVSNDADFASKCNMQFILKEGKLL